MEKPQEVALARTISRRLSSVKVAIRMLQDELDLAGEGRVPLERALLENLVCSLELFVEDTEGGLGPIRPVAGAMGTNGGAERRPALVTEKPLPRMN